LKSRKKTYEDVPSGALLALEGSHGFLEIAANSGNARVLLSMNVGDPVEVLLVTSTRK
jgi:S-adenosylmethionine hydrolase